MCGRIPHMVFHVQTRFTDTDRGTQIRRCVRHHVEGALRLRDVAQLDQGGCDTVQQEQHRIRQRLKDISDHDD